MDGPALLATKESDKDQAEGEDAPAWMDSDDERITVSLASNVRLRKLRIAESEDLINGKEYAKRLQRQYQMLYPVPDWASPAATSKSLSRKRRRTSNSSGSQDASGSGDDMSLESEDLSVQPLAKLLNSAESLTISASTGLGQRKKLRPELIDVHRTKDVDNAQPVSFVVFGSEFLADCNSYLSLL